MGCLVIIVSPVDLLASSVLEIVSPSLVLLSLCIDVPFRYYEPAITVKKDVITRRITSLLKVANINVTFFAKSNGPTVRLKCFVRMLSKMSKPIFAYTKLYYAIVIITLKF